MTQIDVILFQIMIFFIEFRFNDGTELPPVKVDTFEIFQKVSFPKSHSPKTAVIHEDLQVRLKRV